MDNYSNVWTQSVEQVLLWERFFLPEPRFDGTKQNGCRLIYFGGTSIKAPVSGNKSDMALWIGLLFSPWYSPEHV